MEKHCHSLPREVMDGLSLLILQTRLNGALSNLVWWKIFLPIADELG